MEIVEIFTLLSRPAAMIAAAAGIIALSLVFGLRTAARTRTDRRRNEIRKARQIVSRLRRAPRMPLRKDRLEAVALAKEVTDIADRLGLPLHEVGTSKSEIDRVLYLVREDVMADPRCDQPNAVHRMLNPREPGTPGIPINDASSDAKGEQVLFDATFADGELQPSSGTEAADALIVIEVVAPATTTSDPEPPHPEPDARRWDPLQALRSLDDDALDAFVDERFDAMREDD